MLGSASSEFVALCQSQVLLLTQALGASSTVVYLAEQSSELGSPTLVPLVAYPDTADVWTGLQNALSTLENALPAAPQDLDQPEGLEPPIFDSINNAAALSRDPNGPGTEAIGDRVGSVADVLFASPNAAIPTEGSEAKPPSAQPLILPLAHEGVVLGVMVSTRHTPAWNREDYRQAEQVANSLAIACVMDQRNQWLQSQLQQRQFTQADQSQTFHDLLHQFRNPLTALQTFGKLLLKRLQPDDPNHSIAEGIVRETGRLQDLAQTFDDAIARGDANLAEAATAMPLDTLLLPGANDEEATSLESQGASPGTGHRGPLHALPPEVEREAAALSPADQPSSAPTPPHQDGDDVHSLGRRLNPAPGTIATVVEPLLLSAVAIAQDREMALIHAIPADLPEVWLDAAALREVLSNLLDNALKYAPRGALIWVVGGLVQPMDSDLYQGIAIGDTGPGIPLQDQGHIFERHYRGVQAESQTPGTGLGLAIVRELVEAMDGKIDLISPVQLEQWLPTERLPQSPGPGSLFIVWLKTV